MISQKETFLNRAVSFMTCGYCINVAAFAYLELSHLVLNLSAPCPEYSEEIQAAFAWTQGDYGGSSVV